MQVVVLSTPKKKLHTKVTAASVIYLPVQVQMAMVPLKGVKINPSEVALLPTGSLLCLAAIEL